ncbi:MAG: hypothetical protein MPJ78_07820 [Hyphomicrobiaceae bacterium]|nr:hypothetical protein [Hyphomicrobiaceae bacterium]
MAGQTEMALAKEENQRKTTKTKKKRSASTKKSGSATRKKSAASRTAKQAEGGGLPIMKLRAIDIVDGSGTKAADPDKTNEQDNEQPQVIHMPPPAANEVRAADESMDQSADGSSVESEDHANENQVSDPELLELLEQLSVTIDTANTVLDAAVNVPPDGSQPPPQIPSEQTPSETDGTQQMQQSQSPQPQFDRLADRLSGVHQEKDDLRPLAERFASKPNLGETGRTKHGKFGLVANAALTAVIVAAGVGWLAYTNPWILESGKDAATPAPATAPEQAATVKPQETASATPEAAKVQAQLADERAPLPNAGSKVETAAQTPAVAPAPAAPKPALSALTPPDDDPVPMENAANAPAEPTVLKPVRGTAGDNIALNIALPADAGTAEMSIMVQSVPKETKLSAGKNLGSGNWLLTTGQLDGLTLNTQRDLQPGQYQVEIIMVRSDGKVPEARKLAVLVDAAQPPAQPRVQRAPAREAVAPKPADGRGSVAVAKPDAPAAPLAPAAPVEAQPTLPPLSQNQVSSILDRGDALLREGDVAGARLLLGYAAARGHKEAMLKLARSYDPEYLAKLGVRGVQPDAAKAAHWYEQARRTATAQ